MRVHSMLADVHPHDVWAISLKGGGDSRTMGDFLKTFRETGPDGLNPTVRSLFAVRWVLGRIFRWDDTRVDDERSYVSRVTARDRSLSIERPGTLFGSFRVIYTFENEALAEVINRTVHAFLAFFMVRVEDGYEVYWAIYVKPVSWLTPLYMRLIDPFRRWIVYPAMIRSFERSWARLYGDRGDPTSAGEGA